MNEMKQILLRGEPVEVERELPRAAMLLFAPIDKRAFGVAIGTVSALAIAVLTGMQLIFNPQPSLDLPLVSQYFPGYAVSWKGALIGAAWVFATGFCAGWFTAFARNLVLALSLFFLRSRAELSGSKDFLDHI